MSEIELASQNGLAIQMQYAQAVSTAGLLPAAYRGRPADIMLAMGLGQSMGLSPAESLYRIDVIQGKPTASAELIASNVRKAGHKLRMRVTEDPPSATCTIVRCDDPDEPITVTRDVEWARKMGLLEKDNYKRQPSTMLSWRAITACARLACSEALYGVNYTADELIDSDEVAAATGSRLGDALADQAAPKNDSGPEVSREDPDLTDSVAPDGDVGSPSPESPPDKPMTAATRKKMFGLFTKKGVVETDQLPGINHITGKTYTSRADITEDDGKRVIEVLLTRPDVARDEPEGGDQ